MLDEGLRQLGEKSKMRVRSGPCAGGEIGEAAFRTPAARQTAVSAGVFKACVVAGDADAAFAPPGQRLTNCHFSSRWLWAFFVCGAMLPI